VTVRLGWGSRLVLPAALKPASRWALGSQAHPQSAAGKTNLDPPLAHVLPTFPARSRSSSATDRSRLLGFGAAGG